MIVIRATLLSLFLLILLCTSNVYAAWKIELTSGRTVEANSYRVEKGRAYLKFPVGEVSFPVSEIKSAVSDDQEVSSLQKQGVAQAKGLEETRAQGGGFEFINPTQAVSVLSQVPASPIAPVETPDSAVKAMSTPEGLDNLMRNSVPVQGPAEDNVYDPQAEEIIGEAENAGEDEAKLAEVEKKMHKLFEDDENNAN